MRTLVVNSAFRLRSWRNVFAETAGHTDGRVTRQTLRGGLEWLWQGYTAK